MRNPLIFFLPLGLVAPVSVARADVTIPEIVVQDHTEKPLSGATVIAEANLTSFRPRRSLIFGSGVTSATGTWTVPPVPADAGTVTVHVWMPGKTITSRLFNPRDTKQKPDGSPFKLLEVKPIRFRLVDWKNQPIRGGKVIFAARQPKNGSSGYYSKLEHKDWKFNPEVKADAEGWFTAPFGGEGDLLRFSVQCEGFQTIPISLQVPQEYGLAIRMVPDARVHGKLVDKAGKPLAGVPISTRSTIDFVTTDANGEFTLTGLDDRPVFLTADLIDLVVPAKSVAPERGKTYELGTVTATPGCLVTGTLVDEVTGKPPVTRNQLQVSPAQQDRATINWWKSAEIDAEGKFQVRLPEGKFQFTYFSPLGGAPLTQEITIGPEDTTRNLDLKWTPRRAPGAPLALPIPTGNTGKATEAEEPPDYVYGTVVDDETGKPVPGATVTVSQENREVREARSNAQGKYVLGPLRGEIAIAGHAVGLARGTRENPAPPVTLLASAPGLYGAPTRVHPGEDKPIVLRLTKARDLKLRVVTSQGDPIQGASISVRNIEVHPGNTQPTRNLPIPAPAAGLNGARTAADGTITIPGLPSVGFCEISIEHPDFAEFKHTVALPRKGVVTLMLPKSANITGRIFFGDEVLKGKGLSLKAQTWSQYQLWRTSILDENGIFDVKNIPSIESMHEPGLNVNLNLEADKIQLQPGLTVEYVKPHQNWNVLLTDERNGPVKRWLAYVEELPVFEEGQRVQFDLRMVPLARVQGKIKLANTTDPGSPLVVSYKEPLAKNKIGYQMPQVPVDAQGNFEIWVPSGGDVILEVRPQGRSSWDGATTTETLQNVLPHETRTLEFTITQPVNQRSMVARTLTYRVLGPDGATVPRITLPYKTIGNTSNSRSQSYSQMDGSGGFSDYNSAGDTVEISTPYLDKPVRLKWADKDVVHTIKLDRMPETVPDIQSQGRPYNPGTLSAPERSALVGDAAPEFKDISWTQGGPVRLVDLKGKIVVLLFGAQEASQMTRVKRLFQENPGKLVLIKISRPGEQFANLGNAPETPANEPIPPLAIGQDTMAANHWQGYNERLYGGQGFPIIIGTDGRIVANSLRGAVFAAKLEQLVEEMG